MHACEYPCTQHADRHKAPTQAGGPHEPHGPVSARGTVMTTNHKILMTRTTSPPGAGPAPQSWAPAAGATTGPDNVSTPGSGDTAISAMTPAQACTLPRCRPTKPATRARCYFPLPRRRVSPGGPPAMTPSSGNPPCRAQLRPTLPTTARGRHLRHILAYFHSLHRNPRSPPSGGWRLSI